MVCADVVQFTQVPDLHRVRFGFHLHPHGSGRRHMIQKGQHGTAHGFLDVLNERNLCARPVLGDLKQHQRIGFALRAAYRIRFQADHQGNVLLFQRDNEGCGAIALRRHDVQQVAVRQFWPQNLKERRPAVGDRGNGPGLPGGIVDQQRSGDIGRGEYLDRCFARFKGHSYCARTQGRRHRQQGAFALIRPFAVLLNLAVVQGHHLAQTLLKQCLRVRLLGGSRCRLGCCRRGRGHCRRGGSLSDRGCRGCRNSRGWQSRRSRWPLGVRLSQDNALLASHGRRGSHSGWRMFRRCCRAYAEQRGQS